MDANASKDSVICTTSYVSANRLILLNAYLCHVPASGSIAWHGVYLLYLYNDVLELV